MLVLFRLFVCRIYDFLMNSLRDNSLIKFSNRRKLECAKLSIGIVIVHANFFRMNSERTYSCPSFHHFTFFFTNCLTKVHSSLSFSQGARTTYGGTCDRALLFLILFFRLNLFSTSFLVESSARCLFDFSWLFEGTGQNSYRKLIGYLYVPAW
jgi:hypothetical protein